jgi:hypothetical protein
MDVDHGEDYVGAGMLAVYEQVADGSVSHPPGCAPPQRRHT